MITNEMLNYAKDIVLKGLQTKGWIEEYTKSQLQWDEIAFNGNGKIHHSYLYLDIPLCDEEGDSHYFMELYKEYMSHEITIWIHHPNYDSKNIVIYCNNYIDEYVKKLICDTFKYD